MECALIQSEEEWTARALHPFDTGLKMRHIVNDSSLIAMMFVLKFSQYEVIDSLGTGKHAIIDQPKAMCHPCALWLDTQAIGPLAIFTERGDVLALHG